MIHQGEKIMFKKLAFLIVLASMILTACQPAVVATEAPVVDAPAATEAPVEAPVATEAPLPTLLHSRKPLNSWA